MPALPDAASAPDFGSDARIGGCPAIDLLPIIVRQLDREAGRSLASTAAVGR